MAGLTAGRLAGRFTQAADARRLLQSVAGRWFAAVAAVQPETTFQFRQPPGQRCVLGAQLRILGLQGRNHRIAARRGRGAISAGGGVGRCHRHGDAYPPATCQDPTSSQRSGQLRIPYLDLEAGFIRPVAVQTHPKADAIATQSRLELLARKRRAGVVSSTTGARCAAAASSSATRARSVASSVISLALPRGSPL